MRVRKVLGTGIVALAGLASPTLAHLPPRPHFYVWNLPPDGLNLPLFQAEGMYETVFIDTFVEGTHTAKSPVVAAQEMADRVASLSDLGVPLVVILKNIGRDFEDQDYLLQDGLPPIPTNWNFVTRFFYPDDRIPGEADSIFTVKPVGYHSDYGTARTYRHPFIKNAMETGIDSSTLKWKSPLKQWVQEFADAYALTGAAVPQKWNFDTEALIVLPPGPNAVQMLVTLASHSDYWSVKTVPGYPAGKTLASLYQDERDRQVAAYGSTTWPASPTDAATGLAPTLDASHPRNRAIMLWYQEIAWGVQNFTMNNCIYSVLKAKFPSANLQMGNYDDMTCDGVNDQTGAFEDRRNTGNPAVDNTDPAGAARLAATQLPRVNFHPQWGGGLYREPSGRWLGLRKTASGDVSSPYLYQIDATGLDGNDGAAGPVPGHRQRNLYMRPVSGVRPWETDSETSLRIARHSVESVINSGSGQHNDKLVPWVQMSLTAVNDNPQNPEFARADLTRPLLAMLRAKNLNDVLLFTSWYYDFGSQTTNTLADSWTETVKLIHAVWASELTYGKWTAGTLHVPDSDNVIVNDSINTTLRNSSGQEVTTNLNSTPAGPPTQLQPITTRTELQLTYSLPDYGPSHLIDSDFNGFMVNIECSTNQSTTRGVVWVWLHTGPGANDGVWAPAQSGDNLGLPANQSNTYGFYGPVDSDTFTRCRRTLLIPKTYGSAGVPVVDSDGILKLRLEHRNTVAFTSKYDLVQVIPTYYHTTGAWVGVIPLIADVNEDGLVDEADFIQFLGDWMDGAPPADLDLNDSVDGTDLETFINAYEAEG